MLVNADGERQSATVTAVPGTGKSGKKTLNFTAKGETLEEVPHGDDRVEGEPYWLLPYEKDVEPEPEKPKTRRQKKAK